jgi:hypothetical protein
MLGFMDYVRPVEAVIPGVQGRLLAILARSEMEMTMRTVARLAGVSVNRASEVLNRLVLLGLVERREAGSAALVGLARQCEASRAVLRLAGLRDEVIARLRAEANTIAPPPASLLIFGSFARGEAREGSDLDILAVRPAGLSADDRGWVDGLGSWADRAGRIVGNPVNLLEASVEEMRQRMLRPGSVWEAAAREGLVLAGSAPVDLRISA